MLVFRGVYIYIILICMHYSYLAIYLYTITTLHTLHQTKNCNQKDGGTSDILLYFVTRDLGKDSELTSYRFPEIIIPALSLHQATIFR